MKQTAARVRMALAMKTTRRAAMKTSTRSPFFLSRGMKAASHTAPKAKAKPIPQALGFWKKETKKSHMSCGI